MAVILSAKVNHFVKKNYPDSKADLFAIFIERCIQMLHKNGLQAMITQQGWMFLSSYIKLRNSLLKKTIISMLQLGTKAFEEIGGEVVQTTTFVITNVRVSDYKATYSKLTEASSQQKKEIMFLEKKNKYISKQENFSKIPGDIIVYWLPERVYQIFAEAKNNVKTYSVGEGKNVTTNNARYILYSWEINNKKIGAFDYKWLPCAMGGEYRKWYGNIVNVIDWSVEARVFYKKNPAGRIIREEFWNLPGVTWGKIGTGLPSFRILDNNQMYQETAILQTSLDDTIFILSLLNTKVAQYFLSFLAPTINFQLQDICAIPLPDNVLMKKDIVINKGKECLALAKSEWDCFEISSDFYEHPLVRMVKNCKSYCFDEKFSLEKSYILWEKECNERFNQLKLHEIELNRIFIGIYGLQDELTSDVDEKDITVRKADLKRDISSLISYAVGCMFGRYSLDVEGLAYAGGEWDSSKYKTFIPDDDNCIPITDEEYFEDDIVGRFCEFLKVVFGEESLEENLNYVAQALGNKGNTSREIIRNYFLNDFFKDHCSTYSVTGSGKRPIYWLFDAGKQNGFKCLIYMHRYDKDTVNRVRSEYLKKMQDAIEGALKNAEYAVDNSSSAVDRAAATRKRDKYIKQLNEIRAYYPALSHMALQRIEIDLDDGVKTNYAKLQGIETVDENGKKQKVDLLAKI